MLPDLPKPDRLRSSWEGFIPHVGSSCDFWWLFFFLCIFKDAQWLYIHGRKYRLKLWVLQQGSRYFLGWVPPKQLLFRCLASSSFPRKNSNVPELVLTPCLEMINRNGLNNYTEPSTDACVFESCDIPWSFFQTVKKKYSAVKTLNPPPKEKLERFIESDFRPEKIQRKDIGPCHGVPEFEGVLEAERTPTLGTTLTLHKGTWSHSRCVC